MLHCLAVMKIESPFGFISVIFFRNNHCRLYVNGTDFIIINGVALKFEKEFAIFNHQWRMVGCDSRGEFFQSSHLDLRYHDWKRNGAPSSNAYDKLKQWIEAFFIPDLHRGIYTEQLNEAERNFYKREISDLSAKIAGCKRSIEEFENLIAKHTGTLAILP